MHLDKKRSNAISGTMSAVLIIIVIIVAAVAVYVSLGTRPGSTTTVVSTLSGSTSTVTSTVVSTLSPIKIGYITSLSGVQAAGGSEGLVGAQLAVDEINNNGGVGGRPLQLVVLDDQSSATVAVADATQVNTQDNVLVITGSAFAGASASIRGYAENNQVPYLDNLASDPAVTQPGTNWSVRLCWDSVSLGAIITQYILEQNPNARIAVAYVNDISYFVQIYDGIQWEVKTSGHGSIVAAQGFPIYQTDFSASIAAIKAASPDVVIDLTSGSASFYAGVLSAGFQPNQIWLDTDQPTDLLPLGNTASGVYTLSMFSPANANSTNGIAAFNQKASPTLVGCTQCGHTVTWDAEYAYLSIYMIANAASHAESSSSGLTRASFMSALKAYPYHDPIQNISFNIDANGAMQENFWVVQIQNLNVTAGTWNETVLKHVTVVPGQIPSYQIVVNATK